MPDAPPRPTRTGRPVALFVFSSLAERRGGLTAAWLRRLATYAGGGWDTHVATILPQPDADETIAGMRARGILPASTQVHHYQRRDTQLRARWRRPDDERFSRDDRVADWLDWLVGRMPGVVVHADSPVTYAPVALMRNPHVARVMTVHLSHRFGGLREVPNATAPASRYSGVPGRPKLQDRFLPFASAADVVVAPTHLQAEHLRQDLPGVDVRTIPNIVDPAALGTTRPGESPPQPDPLLVVSVGRLEPLKRLNHAIRAFAEVVRAVPGARLEIHGLGPDLARLQALASELGLDDAVSFPGFTDRPGRVLAGAALSVLTSAREAFGLAVAESLAVGTPVVCYDIDYGPGELVQDGVNGRLVANGSVKALAATIIELLTDPATVARMRAAAPASVGRLHPDVVGRAWLDLAAEVASRVAVPDGELLVEDILVRRHGLLLTAIPVGTQAGSLPVRLGLDEPGHPGQGPVDLESPSADGDVRGMLPWSMVEGWPVGAAVRAWAADGREVPVLAPSVRRAVVPTDHGPRVIGPATSGALVALDPAELGDPAALLVRATPTVARIVVDDEITFVTAAMRARGVLRPGGVGDAARVEVTLDLPGLGLEPGSCLGLAATLAGHPVLVGAVGPLTEGPADPAAGGRTWVGEVTWDADALAQLGDPADGCPVSLAIGRTPRPIGPVSAAAGRTAVAPSGTRWLVVRSPRGRALLVPDHGGVRGLAATSRRRLRLVRRRAGALLRGAGGIRQRIGQRVGPAGRR